MKKRILAILIAVTFFAATAVFAKLSAQTASPTISTVPTSSAQNLTSESLRISLARLLTQHVDLMSETMRNKFDDANAYGASKAAVDQNSTSLSQLIGAVYGSDDETKFHGLWSEQTDYLINYSEALRKNDIAMKNQALINLNKYIWEASTYLASLNPNVSQRDADVILRSHVNSLRAIADAYDGTNYQSSYMGQLRAADQMMQITEVLSNAISKQFPNRF